MKFFAYILLGLISICCVETSFSVIFSLISLFSLSRLKAFMGGMTSQRNLHIYEFMIFGNVYTYMSLILKSGLTLDLITMSSKDCKLFDYTGIYDTAFSIEKRPSIMMLTLTFYIHFLIIK